MFGHYHKTLDKTYFKDEKFILNQFQMLIHHDRDGDVNKNSSSKVARRQR